jgi:hypothetical protein
MLLINYQNSTFVGLLYDRIKMHSIKVKKNVKIYETYHLTNIKYSVKK